METDAVSVRILARYDYGGGDIHYRTESSSGVVRLPYGAGVRKRILGFVEVPKGMQLPRDIRDEDEFREMIEDRGRYVHWKDEEVRSDDLFSPRDRETFRRAVEQWGVGPQVDMANEEAAEAILKFAKIILTNARFMRGRYDEADMIEVLADGRIMLEQLTEFFGRQEVYVEVRRKMNRLRDRLAADDGGREE